MGNSSSRPGSPASPSAEPSRNPRALCVAWFGSFLIAFALYAATANRGTQWQDSGYHILRIVTKEPLNPLGLALSHPLHHWLGRLAVSLNLFEPCFAITLVSALGAAIAVANTLGCVVSLTRQWPAALFAALSLAFAHTFWQMATLTESYTLAAALLSGEIWCLILYAKTRRSIYLWGALLLNGLGISNHLLAALTTPVIVAVAIFTARTKTVFLRNLAVGAIVWTIGAAPYGLMILGEFGHSGDLGATLQSALFGHGYRGDVLNTSLSVRAMLISAAFIILNFPNLLLPAATYGIAGGPRIVPSIVHRALLAGLILHALFALRYPIVDQHTFFIPMYVLLSVFGGIGFARVLQQIPASRRVAFVGAGVFLALTPCLYAVLPGIARECGILESRERHRPYRDDYVYVFTPWSIVERSAERMSREAVMLAGENGLIIVEDRMAEFAVWYQARKLASDRLQIVHGAGGEALGFVAEFGRPVVLVPANVDRVPDVPENCSWRRRGDLYLLRAIVDKPRTEDGHREEDWDCACPMCTRMRDVPMRGGRRMRDSNEPGLPNKPAP